MKKNIKFKTKCGQKLVTIHLKMFEEHLPNNFENL